MESSEHLPGANLSDAYNTHRLESLKNMFPGLSGQEATLPPDTLSSLSRSMSANDCLAEIEELEGPSELDQKITQARTDYLTVALTRPTIRNRVARKAELARTEEEYTDAVIGKISAVVEANGINDAIELRQVYSLITKTTFPANGTLELKDFAANHLYLLSDTVLKEHVARRHTIEQVKSRSLSARLLGNRVLHLGIAAGIFAAGIAPEVVHVPTPSEYITTDIEWALKATSAVIFGIDAPEVIRLRYLDRKHNKRTEELKEQLAGNRELADLALRISYGSINYGSSKGYLAVTGHFGTDDKNENLDRFRKLNKDFNGLGKTFTGDQALGYAARFLIERKDQINAVIASGNNPQEQRELYLKVCREIIGEDLMRMKKGLTINRLRKNIMKVVAIVPATLFPDMLAQTSDAVELSQDVVANLSSKNED